MGFGLEELVPIDIVTLFLAGFNAKKYYLLLVDEFFRFNKIPEKHIKLGLEHTLNALETLSRVYDFSPVVLICSDFMNSQDYKQVLDEIKERIGKLGLTQRLQQTAENKSNAETYSLHEIACVEYLRRKYNMQIKIGPSKEKIYDSLMCSLGLNIDFAYVIDAYALGARPNQVIHYVYKKEEVDKEQRLFLEDHPIKARFKLANNSVFTFRYLLKLASFAGYVLNQDYLTENEIKELEEKDLEETVKDFVTQNIIISYHELSGGFFK